MPAIDDEDLPRSNGLATGALVCGLIGLLFPPLGLVGLILGIIALTKGQSRGMAITGIVLGGFWLLLAPVAIVAAIAIPNLLESRITANEAAARSTLTSGIFPAEIQYQAGGYLDRDRDDIGEYGDLAAMRTGTRLLGGALATGDLANGYRYVVYVPEDADGGERHFIAYAWPTADQGRKTFALSEDGQVRVSPETTRPGTESLPPSWDQALPDGWGTASNWPIATR